MGSKLFFKTLKDALKNEKELPGKNIFSFKWQANIGEYLKNALFLFILVEWRVMKEKTRPLNNVLSSIRMVIKFHVQKKSLETNR